MENLLNPDKGLIVWTIISFTFLVLLLGKVAWKPLLQSLKDREDGIRRAIDDATQARLSADALKAQYERALAEGQGKAQEMVAQAQIEAVKLREDMMRQAEADARRLAEQTQRQLEEEKARLSRELRRDVAGLSIQVAEKLLRHSVNAKEQDALLQGFLNDIEQEGRRAR